MSCHPVTGLPWKSLYMVTPSDSTQPLRSTLLSYQSHPPQPKPAQRTKTTAVMEITFKIFFKTCLRISTNYAYCITPLFLLQQGNENLRNEKSVTDGSRWLLERNCEFSGDFRGCNLTLYRVNAIIVIHEYARNGLTKIGELK